MLIQRFNVAVTRAQALLVVIGNPRLLCRDQYWRCLLEYCILNGSYQGEEFSLTDPDQKDYGAFSCVMRWQETLMECKLIALCVDMLRSAREDLAMNSAQEDREVTGGGFWEQ